MRACAQIEIPLFGVVSASMQGEFSEPGVGCGSIGRK
jgi:hypothetical protein